MRRRLIALSLLPLLAACGERKYEDQRKYLAAWQGKTTNELIADWGQPDLVEEYGAEEKDPRAYQKSLQYIYHVNVCDGVTESRAGAYQKPKQNCHFSLCTVDFRTDRVGIVTSAGYGGNEDYMQACQMLKEHRQYRNAE